LQTQQSRDPAAKERLTEDRSDAHRAPVGSRPMRACSIASTVSGWPSDFSAIERISSSRTISSRFFVEISQAWST